MRRLFLFLLFVLGLFLGTLGQTSPGSLLSPIKGEILPSESFLTIDVYYAAENRIVTLDLEDYVKGVLAQEMPASFHPEALKAQAICARTYAVRKMRVFGGDSYSQDADVSSDHRVDQAWAPDEVLKKKWGAFGTWVNMPKIEKAVRDTLGLILTCKGNPCQALYHSTCGGQTEASEDVFSTPLPYLVSVPCTFCEHSPSYKQQTTKMSKREVSQLLSQAGHAIPVSSMAKDDFAKVSDVSPAGRLKEVIVGGEAMRGLNFRMALGLKSTMMSWKVQGDDILFSVKGYGHGVGMCQYGADGMGSSGRTYIEILDYYYPGTLVSHLFAE